MPSKPAIDSRDLLERIDCNRQQIEKLNHSLGSVQKEYSEDFVQVRIDKSLDEQFKIIKQVISQTYSYDLIIDRGASPQVFMDALKVSQQRLILVYPWISTYSINSEVLAVMEDALIRGVFIDDEEGFIKNT